MFGQVDFVVAGSIEPSLLVEFLVPAKIKALSSTPTLSTCSTSVVIVFCMNLGTFRGQGAGEIAIDA